jgi:hypothetical protein
MKIHDALLVIAIALGGCTTVRSESPIADRDAAGEAASICKLAANGLAEGQTARVAVTYKTDKSHYAYLTSEGCGKKWRPECWRLRADLGGDGKKFL